MNKLGSASTKNLGTHDDLLHVIETECVPRIKREKPATVVSRDYTITQPSHTDLITPTGATFWNLERFCGVRCPSSACNIFVSILYITIDH